MMTYIEAAIGYATVLGFPIFPASRVTKKPLIKTGRDHAEHASRDPAQIRQWFEREFPYAAIAMPTGAASGVVVIDADAKHDGERLLAQLETRLGVLPRNMVVRTQSGGLHVYTRHPGAGIRIKSTAGELIGPGVDIRGDGGIVLLPPSPGYSWIASVGDFASLPPAWIAELQAPRRRALDPVDVGPLVYSGAIDTAACMEALRSLRRRYRTRGRDGDVDRGELIDRIINGEALGTAGNRDVSVTRAGYIVGRLLPGIGPSGAELLAWKSLIAIPVALGESEDTAHWRRKFRAAYEDGARARREDQERERRLWLEIADAASRLSC